MAFPTTPNQTDFHGLNENPLSEGGKWSPTPQQSGQPLLKRLSNQAVSSGALNASSYWLGVNAADVEVLTAVATLPTNTHGFAVWFRIQNPGNITTAVAYLWVYTVGRGFDWYSLLGNNFTNFAGPFTPHTLAPGEKIGASVSGTTITGFYGIVDAWTQVDTRTDTTVSGAGYLGLSVDDTTAALSLFGGGATPYTIPPAFAVAFPSGLFEGHDHATAAGGIGTWFFGGTYPAGQPIWVTSGNFTLNTAFTQAQALSVARAVTRRAGPTQAQTFALRIAVTRAFALTQAQVLVNRFAVTRSTNATQTQSTSATASRAITRSGVSTQSQTFVVKKAIARVTATLAQAQVFALRLGVTRSTNTTQAQSATSSKAIARSGVSTQNQGFVVKRAITRTAAFVQAQTFAFRIAVSRAFTLTQAQALVNRFAVARSGVSVQSQTFVATTRAITRVATFVQAQVVQFKESITRTSATVTQPQTAATLRQVANTNKVTQAELTAFSRAVVRKSGGTQSQVLARLEAIGRSGAFTQPQGGVSRRDVQRAQGLLQQSQTSTSRNAAARAFAAAQTQTTAVARAVARQSAAVQTQLAGFLASLLGGNVDTSTISGVANPSATDTAIFVDAATVQAVAIIFGGANAKAIYIDFYGDLWIMLGTNVFVNPRTDVLLIDDQTYKFL